MAVIRQSHHNPVGLIYLRPQFRKPSPHLVTQIVNLAPHLVNPAIHSGEGQRNGPVLISTVMLTVGAS